MYEFRAVSCPRPKWSHDSHVTNHNIPTNCNKPIKTWGKTCNWCQKRENTCAKSWLGFILPLIGWENSMFSLLGKSMLHNLIGLRSELSHWLRNIAREFTVKKLSLHQIHLSHFLLALFLFPYTQVLFLSFDGLRSDCYACLARNIDSPWFN